MPPYDLIGLGVSVLDFVTVVEEFPAQESVQQALASALQGGGPVATALAQAARLGSRTAMIDKLGDDWRGGHLVQELASYGVETSLVQIEAGASSSMASIHARKRDGARAIVFSPGSAREIAPDELPFRAIENAKILHMNGRHNAACLAGARFAKEKGVLVSFDGGKGRYRPDLDALLPLADLLIVSLDFARAWLGEADPSALLDKMRTGGRRLAALTMGEKGSLAARPGGDKLFQSAYPVAPVCDTTGCGDVYHGAFLHAFAQEASLADALKLASAAAALNALELGGRGHLATKKELSLFLQKQGETAARAPF